jgi:outer membrane protein assembly factor BamD
MRIAVAAVLAVVALAAGCGGKKEAESLPTVLTTRQMYEQALQEIEQRDMRKAKSLLENIRYVGDEDRELEPLIRLALADATFYQDYTIAYIDARSLYLDFVTFFGTHPRAPYAMFQAAMASLAQANHPAKDQTQTRQAIADMQEVIRRFPVSPFAAAARTMIVRAEERLAEHEFIVGRYYMERKAPLAASERFKALLEQYPHYAEKDKVYLHLGQVLLRLDNEDEAQIWLDKLVQDYPEGAWTDEAIKELRAAGLDTQMLDGTP